jgi:aromatic-L-amino-acid/L-tryptophan decarboxylase
VPDLSIVTFRVPATTAPQDRALARINAHGLVRLSSTDSDGQVALRLAILSHRTRRAHVAHVLDVVRTMATSRMHEDDI